MTKRLHHAYIVCLLVLQFIGRETVQAQTTLVAGDIVILGWNADDVSAPNQYPNQRWVFLVTRSIATNTVIHFTDKGYDVNTSNFRAPVAPASSENDGYMTWTVPSPIAAGTVIFATNSEVNGSTTGVSGQLGANSTGFHPSGDQMIVYQGTAGTAAGATFIYAFNTGQHSTYGTEGSWTLSGIINVTLDYQSYLPPGLTNGSTALSLTSSGSGTPVGVYGNDNLVYGGTISGYRSALLTAIGNPANWLGHNSTPYNLSSGGGVLPNTFTVLPVTLLHFNAEEATSGTVKLTWGTAMESNNDHFTMERSTDGIHYNIISTIPGKGDFNEPVDYSFIDHAPEQGSNFYRLSQTDRDGKEKILGVKTVSLQDIGLRVGPNPVVNTVNVSFNSGAWCEIKLYNSAEQLLQTIPLTITASQTRISLQNYRPGIYYLAFVANNGKSNTVRRFVKKD
jgi:hypothetical protein